MRSRFVVLLFAASILGATAPGFAQGLDRVEPAFGDPAAPSSRSAVSAETSEKAVFLAQYDDGETDLWVTPGTDTAEVAMLLDIGGPEVTLTGTEFCWRRFGADTEIRYDVVIWDNNGAGGSPGTELASFNAIATGVTTGSAFYDANFSYPLTDSSVYIGVRWNPVVDEDFSYCLDFDGFAGAVQPGYRRADEGTWFTFQSTQPDYNALMLRTFGATPPPQPDFQIVPLYEVNTTSASGTTTLFAVRNLRNSSNSVDITYYTVDGVEQRMDIVNLDARETRTVNVRDVAGLDTDFDGVKRGYIEIFGVANTDGTPTFASDFFQVDVGNDFGTGQRTRRLVETCEVESLRFLEFPLPGSGTEITAWVQFPQGTGGGDPASLVVRTYNEAGVFVGSTSFKTDDHVIKFDASGLTVVPFGTFELDFEGASRGFAYAESSTQGRFSVGVDSQCELP